MFSQVVESIYDSAMNPPNWQKTLALIAQLTDSPVTSMGIIDHELGRSVALFNHGIDDESVELYMRRYAVMNPLMIAGHPRPVGSAQAQCRDVGGPLDRFGRTIRSRSGSWLDSWPPGVLNCLPLFQCSARRHMPWQTIPLPWSASTSS